MKKRHDPLKLAAAAILPLVILSAAAARAAEVSFMYTLSDFYGPVPYTIPRMTLDQSRGELYVLYQNRIRVFSGTGMEVYEFGDDLDIGGMIDVAVDEETNIFILTTSGWRDFSIVRCNYRGEPVETFQIKNLPADFSEFKPYRMAYAKGNLYFLSPGNMKVVVTDREGNFKEGYSIRPLLQLTEKQKKEDMDIFGFSVDKDGNIIFTIPVLFAVFNLSPDGKLSSFGQAGNLPGKFNLITGVVRDNRGSYLVVDTLRSTISIFDKDYNFLIQFGHRGVNRDSLFAPNDIAEDNSKPEAGE
jgi:hypothetical protein